jgi:hypothetical protein
LTTWVQTSFQRLFYDNGAGVPIEMISWDTVLILYSKEPSVKSLYAILIRSKYENSTIFVKKITFTCPYYNVIHLHKCILQNKVTLFIIKSRYRNKI